jgi:hypothetical protein
MPGIGRVTRLRARSDQASRRPAHTLVEAERGFHRIRGHADLSALREAPRLPEGGHERPHFGASAGVPPLRASPLARKRQARTGSAHPRAWAVYAVT